MKRYRAYASAIAFSVAALFQIPAIGAELDLAADGWSSWEVDRVSTAPSACCYTYRDDQVQPSVCELDGRQHGYTRNELAAPSTGKARIYALLAGGQLKRVRALDSSCPIRSKAVIAQVEGVSGDSSARWLSAQLRPNGDLTQELMAAIALHDSAVANQTLHRSAEPPTDVDTRKSAIFWLGQTRGVQSAEFLQRQMYDDPSPEIRKHAAFSYSQSDAPNRASALIQQGRKDRSTKVRGQAWFWLAQTEDPGAEQAISAAIADEPSMGVRKEQVFALSQLPDQRAAEALVALVADTSQHREVRKQALFWLAQSDTPSAYAYLDALLMGD